MEGEGQVVTFSSFRVFFVLLLGSSAAADAAAAAMIYFSRIEPCLQVSRGAGKQKIAG